MNLTDFTNSNTNPLPDEARDLVAALIEGRVRSMFLVAEIDNPDGRTAWIEGYSMNMDDHTTDIRSFVGAVQLNLDELKSDIVNGVIVAIEDGDDDDEDLE